MTFYKPAVNHDHGLEAQEEKTRRPRGRPRGSYKKGVPMTPLNFYVTPELYRAVSQMAHDQKKSMGEILRDLIEHEIFRQGQYK